MSEAKTDTQNGRGTMQTAMTPFVPQFMEQAIATANLVSRSLLIPKHLQGKPSDVLVTIMTGYEYGFTPMQALREIYLVDGKPAFSATMITAMCLRESAVCEYFRPVDEESNETKATYETKRKSNPKPTRLTFTIEQAQRAGLTGKDNWKKYPAAMLQRRCATHLARAVYPDLVMGAIEKDEAEEIEVNKAPLRVAPPLPTVEADKVEPAPSPQDTPAPAASAAPAPAAQPAEAPKDQAPPAQKDISMADAVSEVDKLAARIEEAQTIDGLEQLVPSLQKLNKEDQRALKPGFDLKRASLAKGKA